MTGRAVWADAAIGAETNSKAIPKRFIAISTS
jgi:hypothetical protein